MMSLKSYFQGNTNIKPKICRILQVGLRSGVIQWMEQGRRRGSYGLRRGKNREEQAKGSLKQ